jgi:hypothetical protein
MAAKKNEKEAKDMNRDPLTNEPGAHPVGVGVGAAVGGGAAGAALGAAGSTAAAGAVLGAAAGPVGVVAGAVAGGVVGGLIGKKVAESLNPTAEDEYWRENYRSRPYVEQGSVYEEYQPAYRYGWESRGRHEDKSFEEVEADLRSGWHKVRDKSKLEWDKARHAARDAWDRVGSTSLGGPAQGISHCEHPAGGRPKTP